jgi:hypothetical protein
MDEKPSADPIQQELAALEETCRKAGNAVSTARTIREAVECAEVEVPHHLAAIAQAKVHSLRRLSKLRDLRVEEIVNDQLAYLRQERTEVVAQREYDRWKAGDWHVLRANYPEIYAKAFREAGLILERKRQKKR